MTVDLTQYDAETPLPGQQTQYISPTWEQSPDERHVSETLAHLFVAGVIAAKVLDWSGLAKRWTEHGYNSEEFHRHVSDRFVHVLQQSAGAILMRAATMGRTQAMADFSAEFPQSDWEKIAADWSQVYGHNMAKQVADQSEKGIAALVQFLLSRGQKGESLAITAKQAYGLDPRSMNGIISWLSNEKKPRNQTLLDVATSFLTRRAKIIGDVQGFTALNFGRQLTYTEAIDAGLLAPSARKVWVTAIDERVCKVCRPMDGVMVGMNEPFVLHTAVGTVRLFVPPVHPNCRCTVVPEERFRHGIITRRARFRDEGPDHRARLVSALEDLVGVGKSEEVEKFDQTQPRDREGRWVSGGQVLDLDYRSVAVSLNSMPVKHREIWSSHHDYLRYHRTKRALGRSGGDAFEHLHTGVTRWLDMEGVAQVRNIEGVAQTNAGSWRGFLKNHARYDGPLRMLMHTVSYAPANAPVLYRGMAVPSTMELPKKGQKFNLPLSSFAANQQIALTYTGNTPKWYQRKVNTTSPVLVILEGGSKSLNISPIAKYGKSEWLTKGRYVVTGVSARKYDTHLGTQKVKTIYVKQLPKKTRTVEKANSDLVFFDLLATPMPNPESIKKFSEREARDKVGRWTAGAGAAGAGFVAAHGGAATVGFEAAVAGSAALAMAVPSFRKEVLNVLKMRETGVVIAGNKAGQLASIFDGFEHNGYSARLSRMGGVMRTLQGNVQVAGTIRAPSGEMAGTFLRVFKRDGTVDHSFFALEDEHQGSGFGSAFVAHSFDQYRKMGIKAVTVHADIDVGGYTWASMGFKFQDAKAETDLIERIRREGTSGGSLLTADEKYMLNRAADDMANGLDVTPQDIIKIGLDRVWTDSEGHKMWAGKAAMLNGHWHGVFAL